ncbi:MAG: serine hydrolase [Ferruginibacter sp.]
MIKYLMLCCFALVICFPLAAQEALPHYYKTVKSFDKALHQIVKEAGLDSSYPVGEDGVATISLAVIDLNGKRPVFGGVNAASFIYPASVYKMYVAMEILKQVSNGQYFLSRPYIVPAHNVVDKTREISFDPRPLLQPGDTVTVNYLLDLMITRSDNSAANCLIDIATRKSINQTIAGNGWQGSEVTRKFLKRNMEDPGYDTIRSTVTHALHAADFMYKISTGELINPWVSMQMKALLGRQLDTAKLAAGLPKAAMFYHKTGWWSYYTNDVGIVDDGKIKYVIAIFTPVKEEDANPKLKILSARIYELIKNLHR